MNRMTPARLVPPFLLLAFLARIEPARAFDLDLKLEPGFAFSLTPPQTQRFALGGAGTAKAVMGWDGSWISLTGGLTFVGLPAQHGFSSDLPGTAWAPSIGFRLQPPVESEEMRLKHPHDPEILAGAKLWLDADAMYVRTGDLDRGGLAAAVGLSFPLGEPRQVWFGPFVRFFHIFNENGLPGFNNSDDNTLIVGLSLELGARMVRPVPAEAVFATSCPPEVPCASATICAPGRPDRDGDTLPDDIDACPDVPGPVSNSGCPVYERLIVHPDKLELKEKIQFAWNDAVIDPVSFALLNEVAKALQDNKTFRVAIEGNASSEGKEEHNQNLSDHRAAAVLEYLAAHGVARERLVSKGFSSSNPIESNQTEVGREANRRVEFIVQLKILKAAAQ